MNKKIFIARKDFNKDNVKMQLIRFILLILIYFNCAKSSENQNKKIDKVFVSAKTGLFLRSEPNTYFSKKLILIPYQTELEILEEVDELVQVDEFYSNWKKVKFEDKIGFVFGGYLVKDLNEEENFYNLSLKELLQHGESLKKSNPEKSSRIFSIYHKRVYNNPTCKYGMSSNEQIERGNKCINSCFKIIEPIECNFLENQNQISSFKEATTKIISSIQNQKVEELIPFLAECTTGVNWNCYFCDADAINSTTTKEKILDLQNFIYLIDFKKTKINQNEIEFFPIEKIENEDAKKFVSIEGDFFDKFKKEETTFLKIQLVQKGKFWRIGEISGRVGHFYIRTKKRFCLHKFE